MVQGRGSKKAGKRGSSKKGSKKAGGTRSKLGKASGMIFKGDDLSQKIYTTMDKHKEVRCVMVLHRGYSYSLSTFFTGVLCGAPTTPCCV